MYMIAATLVPSGHCEVPDQSVLTDIFWTLTTPEDGLQHVRIVADTSVELVVFLKVASGDAALAAARLLCHRVLATSSYLDGWHVHSVGLLDYETWPCPPDVPRLP
ncbi:hypothetical protein ABT294_00380 [Nonomuraea sp. NPDC000554]|uniref:hypothetical protein n=1 Tax=Nonomuraea sp. NPDC000554 TaxID=3154259 RepID=UPI0033231B05